MMPTRGGGRFRAFLLGSVTVKVLNDAECPVWTDAHMEQAGRDADLEIRSILCAVDDKEESVWIVKRAAGLADLYSAKLNLLRVVPEIDVRNETLRTEWQQELIESARLQLSELRHHTGVTAEIQVSSGSISHAIRKTALECNSNLVVIGRGHAQGLLGRLRTNAYAIIRDSPCPVLSF
jgi:nucleotide-binding universal stress UspA family protein